MPALTLWFAALFGLTSLAIRASLFESLVVASRIDQIVPAAAPPLGHVARLMLALAFAGLGGLIGWGVARAISGPVRRAEPAAAPASEDPLFDPRQTPAEPMPPADEHYQVRARDAHPDAPARRPILAREELRHAEFAAPIAAAAETLHPAVDPAPVFAAAAPPAPAEPAMPPVTHAPPHANAPAWDDAPAWEEGGPVLGPARDGTATPAEPLPILAPALRDHGVAPPAPVSAPVIAAAADIAHPPEPQASAPTAHLQTAAQRIAVAAPAELGQVELIERLAVAMQRREASTLAAPMAVPLAESAAGHPASGAEAFRAALAALKGAGHG